VSDHVLAEALRDRPKHHYFHFLEALSEEPGVQKLRDLSERSKAEGILTAFEEALKYLGFFENSIALDPTGRMESNLWKLLGRLREEWRRPGFSVLEFVREETATMDLDNDDEGDAVSTLEPNRIHFMTVHAAKGLQFSHVLLPRIGKAPRTSQTAWLMVDERRQICTVPWPSEGDPQKISSWTEEKILQQSKALELDEHWRVLYVALTRAKESVHLFMAGSAQKNSWAAELNWLTEKPVGKHGFKDFHIEVLDRPVDGADGTSLRSSEVVVRPLFTKPPVVAANRVRRAVTTLLNQGPSQAEPIDLERLKAAQRGVRLHRHFETFRQRPEREPLFDRETKFLLALQEPPMQHLLESGQSEWGFQVRSPVGVLEGQMDLVGEVEGIHWIVDYKTGSAKYRQKAMDQLQIYGWCLSQHSPAAKIRLAAIFTSAQICEVQDYQPSSAEALFREAAKGEGSAAFSSPRR
jgi:ATP-dependent helicase/nuclease subunit A